MVWLLAVLVGQAATTDWFCLSQEPPPAVGTPRGLAGEATPIGLVPATHRPGRPAVWGRDYVDLAGVRWAFPAVLEFLSQQGHGTAVDEMRAFQRRIDRLDTGRWARRSPVDRAQEERRLRDAQLALLSDALCAVNQGVEAPQPPVIWELDLDTAAVADSALQAVGLAEQLDQVDLRDASQPDRLRTTLGGIGVEVRAVPHAVDATVGWRVDTGAFDDRPEHWGLSHLAEHLVFRHPGYVEWVDDVGGSFNGATHPGMVSLFTTVPAPALPELLERDVDRLHATRFTEADHALELSIVEREEDLRGDLGGAGHLIENDTLFALAFGESPPDPVPRGTARDVRQWMVDYLQPGALTLVIASRFEPEAVLERLEQVLERTAPDWQARKPPARAAWPALDEEVVLPRPGPGTRVTVAFRVDTDGCGDCPESAVGALAERWLVVFGPTRLAEILTQNHRAHEISRPAVTRDDDVIQIYGRSLLARTWVLGADRIVQLDVASMHPDDDRGHLDEIPSLAEELAIQQVVRETDLDALRRWHRWTRDRFAREPEALVLSRLAPESRSRVPEEALDAVTADQVQGWLRAMLLGPPTRTGVYR